MNNNDNDFIFSEEYSTESTNDNSEVIENVLEKSEETLFSDETDNYTITKPKRIIIKATIIK